MCCVMLVGLLFFVQLKLQVLQMRNFNLNDLSPEINELSSICLCRPS